ncbi:MAG: sugar ABC transporter permease [Caldilineaceae bacterium]|nr:sugar ABC transporter permease [Caldilineaceae bacterium]
MSEQLQAVGRIPAPRRRMGLTGATRRRYLLFLALVAPAFLIRFATAAYPIFQTVLLSFTNLSILKGTNEFIGLQNYIDMPGDYGVRGATTFTIIYVLASTALDMIVGMAIALLLNARFRGRAFVRTINLIPWAIPMIAAGYTFRWLLDDQFGLIPYWVFELTGIRMVTFISAWGARLAVILVQVWKEAPFMAIIFLAGLQGLSQDIFEAAKVDGATAWQRFSRITLPLIMPLAITMGLFRIVWSLANFDLVYGLTFGGPGVATSVLALRVFQEGILFFKFGFASAISVVLLIFVGIIGIVALVLFRRTEVVD